MNIDPEKFTELGISAIREMAEVAKRNGQQEVEVWHLLSALMAQENGIVPALMEEMGIGTAPVQLALQRELKNLPKLRGMLIQHARMHPLLLRKLWKRGRIYQRKCRMIMSVPSICSLVL